MIKAIITDFDGTLVDTFEANFFAYQKAFNLTGRNLSKDKYRACFGMRFDELMLANAIFDVEEMTSIRELKKEFYPEYFYLIRPNKALLELIASFKSIGGRKTAIASTARRENLLNVVEFLGIEEMFDSILSGLDVKQGKPDPEIYLAAMATLGVSPDETIIFEDSEIGIEAAKRSGAKYIHIATV